MPLVYMHPPKCAGTSIVRSLRIRFLWKGMGLSAHSMRPVLDGCSEQLDYASYQCKAHQAADAVAAHRLVHGTQMVAGHFWYGEYLRMLDTSVHRMTVLRDPVQRFISHYRYLVWKHGLELEFAEFLTTDKAKQLGSIYGFYFANRYPATSADEDEIVEVATSTLQTFSVIGDVNDVGGFLRNAKQKIGGPLIRFSTNQTPKSMSSRWDANVTDENRFRIMDLTSIDQRIYDTVIHLPNYVGRLENTSTPALTY